MSSDPKSCRNSSFIKTATELRLFHDLSPFENPLFEARLVYFVRREKNTHELRNDHAFPLLVSFLKVDQDLLLNETDCEQMDFKVLIEMDDDGYFVITVPALPGCISQGKTEEEALRNIKEAIELHISLLAEDGIPLTETPKN